ncbi:hypothetical protein [Paenibacillus elgii]|uniref:hypothetical protein n=1 Tax=Paenibacillus elgii TaxID=189691 RepID=UPI0020417D9E|nr:hypothetical protein [Paenibacillus elgii]MCM3273078.1 hypothetical protein [Paenibacillus elgii]
MKFEAYGVITIPFIFESNAESKKAALEAIQHRFKSIMKVDGDIYLPDGSELPLLADKVNVEWLEVISENEL